MSDLSKPREAAEWVAEWERYAAERPSSQARWARFATEAVTHMRRELTQCERESRCPSGWTLDGLRESVAILEAAAQRAKVPHAD